MADRADLRTWSRARIRCARARKPAGSASWRQASRSSSCAPVGSYPGSPSPYGTLDQGGNVWEWNEKIVSGGRGYRGGYWRSDPSIELTASYHGSDMGEFSTVGFRVARPVPEPGQVLLVLTGGLVLAVARRKQRT